MLGELAVQIIVSDADRQPTNGQGRNLRFDAIHARSAGVGGVGRAQLRVELNDLKIAVPVDKSGDVHSEAVAQPVELRAHLVVPYVLGIEGGSQGGSGRSLRIESTTQKSP